jgi:transcriptional regulator GlxA family with amidase domain
MKFNVILFNGFETMDVFGPVEVIGALEKFMEKIYDIEFYSEKGGIIKSSQNVRVVTLPISEIKEADILLIPGGFGTRSEVNNQELIRYIKDLSIKAQNVLTVCTGSALLAKTGLLKSIKATSNKMSFDWVAKQDDEVQWIRKARWVSDGKYYTSSGISAGIDMILGFISDIMGIKVAEKISEIMEYIWNSDKDDDPFC